MLVQLLNFLFEKRHIPLLKQQPSRRQIGLGKGLNYKKQNIFEKLLNVSDTDSEPKFETRASSQSVLSSPRAQKLSSSTKVVPLSNKECTSLEI